LRNPWTGHYSRTFDLLGYADGLIDPGHRAPTPDRHSAGRPLELVENKLVGRIDQVMVQRLPLDRQLQLARYGIWRATGRTVSTVHFRWVKKPSIKRKQTRRSTSSSSASVRTTRRGPTSTPTSRRLLHHRGGPAADRVRALDVG
jgi:hypothetical protein